MIKQEILCMIDIYNTDEVSCPRSIPMGRVTCHSQYTRCPEGKLQHSITWKGWQWNLLYSQSANHNTLAFWVTQKPLLWMYGFMKFIMLISLIFTKWTSSLKDFNKLIELSKYQWFNTIGNWQKQLFHFWYKFFSKNSR